MICTGFALGFAILHCDDKKVVSDSFCRVMRATIRNELRLTKEEIAGLRRGTKEDLAALKRQYKKHCK